MRSASTMRRSRIPGKVEARAARAAISLALTYVSDGDTNGVCWWIGTNYGVEAWQNPHTATRVTVSQSSSAGSQYGFVERMVDRIANSVGTDNVSNSWIKIDLGAANKIKINYYSLKGRSDNANDNWLQTWKLQGSNDNTTWTDIDSQTNNPVPPGNWKSLPVTNQTNSYRYVRILQTGLTSTGENFLVLGEFEFYGVFAKS